MFRRTRKGVPCCMCLFVSYVACADPAIWFAQTVREHVGIEAGCTQEFGGRYETVSSVWCRDRYRIGEVLRDDAWAHAYIHGTTNDHTEPSPRGNMYLRAEYGEWSFREALGTDTYRGVVWRSVQYRVTQDMTLGYERVRGFGSAVRLKYMVGTALSISGVVGRKDGDLVAQAVFMLDF